METTAKWRQAVREEPMIRAPDWECRGRGMIEGNRESLLFILKKVACFWIAP